MASVSHIQQIFFHSDITLYEKSALLNHVVQGLQEAPEEVTRRIFSFILGVETYYAEPTNADGAKMFTATISPHNARMALLFYRALSEGKKPESHFIIFERILNIIAADNLKNKELPPVICNVSPIDMGPPFDKFCKEKSLYSGRGINVRIEYRGNSVSIKDESMEGFRLPLSGSSLFLKYNKERIKDFATDFESFFFVALDTHLEIYPLANRNTFVVGSPTRLDLQFWRIFYLNGVLHGDLEPPGPSSLVKLNFAFPSSDPALIPKKLAGYKVIDPGFNSMYTVLPVPVPVPVHGRFRRKAIAVDQDQD